MSERHREVVIDLHHDEERTYQQPDDFMQKDHYSTYIHGKDDRILRILNTGDDVKNVSTEG